MVSGVEAVAQVQARQQEAVAFAAGERARRDVVAILVVEHVVAGVVDVGRLVAKARQHEQLLADIQFGHRVARGDGLVRVVVGRVALVIELLLRRRQALKNERASDGEMPGPN